MSRVSKALQRLVGGSLQLSNGQRAVSTSARVENSLSIDLDVNVKQCPFRATMGSLTLGRGEEVPVPVPVPQASQEKPAVQPFEAVPGPKGLPIVGTLLDYFKKDGLKFSKMFEAYQARALQFGAVYKEQLGPIELVVISDPAEYAKVMRAEGKFPNRREMEPMVYYRQQRGLDLGLVNSQGEEWHRQRTAVSKHMLRLQAVGEFCRPMDDVAQQFCRRLEDVRDRQGQVQGLEKEIFKWAMESIGTFLFEERIGCLESNPSQQAQSFIHHLRSYFQLMQPLLYNLPIYKLFPTRAWQQYQFHSDQVMKIGQTFVDKKVEALKQGEAGNTSAFLSELIANQNLSSKDVTGITVDLLMAAVETTSTVTTWCLYSLAQNPQAQRRLLAEVNSVVPDGGEITPDHLAQMPYLKAVVKETFRIYPITYATSRILPNDIEVAGYNIPAGSHVQANLFGMFRDAELFPEPDKFQPSRWLREGNMDPKLKSLSNLVWGHGARMCIGRRVAEQEIHLLLAKAVQRFQLSYEHEDVQPVLNTVMTPDRPVRITFTPRH
ncbi:cytochrome P450 10-like [Babylonia areolata]|uniref:cytochrome P450 10-like n=1 Tax=Babylonia areolata TaxID=304850 RepID=UPI003FD0E4DF